MEMKLSKHDIFLIAGILSVSVLLFVAGFFAMRGGGASVVVTVDGKTYGTYALDENQTVTISTSYGTNILVIEDGCVRMQEADCPDHYCVGQGAVQKLHQTIICLPHKLVVEVTGEGAGETENQMPDAVAY